MQEIMEEKLPLIYSNSLEYEPLVNVDFVEEFTRNVDGTAENSGTSNSSSNNDASGLNITSDTPQGQINKQEILNGKYASQTNASETTSFINDETSTNSKGNSNTKENYIRHTKGNNGVIITNQRLIKEFRDIIVSINKDIISELNKLFMGLY